MGKKPENFGIELYPHNQRAYEKLVSMLEHADRACVIEPPGCGKSFIAYKLIADNPEKKFLWLGPNDYVFAEQKANFEREGSSLPDNLVTMTYATAMVRGRDGTLDVEADYIILDEFHHCGAPEWSKGVDAVVERCPSAKLVGLSATEVRYNDNARDMSLELFHGNVASRMSFDEAWIRGILAFPKYICALYDAPAELENVLMRINEVRDMRKHSALMMQYEKLRRAIEQADGLDDIFKKHLVKKDAKIIVFCSNVEQMQSFYLLRRDWFKQVNPDIHAYKTYSANPYGSKDYEDFKADDSTALKLLYCVNQLNEGVHISGINAVVMVRPTQSPVVYKQQLGRALDVGNENEPIVFDLVNNLESTGHIIAYRESMQALYEQLRKDGAENLFDPKDFTIIDEVRDPRFIMKEMEEAANPELFSVAERRPELVDEWDYERNEGKSPYTTDARSTERVWWVCPVGGHGPYEESPLHRTWTSRDPMGCPICSSEAIAREAEERESAGKKHKKKDLPSRLPSRVARFWHKARNGVSAKNFDVNDRSVLEERHWTCGSHFWTATVEWQMQQKNCPFCDRTVKPGVNDIVTRMPDSVVEWDADKNGGLMPGNVSSFSDSQYWWKCGNGHGWKDSPREHGGCPVCSGQITNPRGSSIAECGGELVGLFDEEANKMTASCVSVDAVSFYTWHCRECGNRWRDAPVAMRGKPYCPYCADEALQIGLNDVKTKFPQMAIEWKSKDARPDRVFYKEDRDVEWRCLSCGEEWTGNLRERVERSLQEGRVAGCPYCDGDSVKGRTRKDGFVRKVRAERKKDSRGTSIAYVPEWLREGASVRSVGYGIGTVVLMGRDNVFVEFGSEKKSFKLRDVVGKGVLTSNEPIHLTIVAEAPAEKKAAKKEGRRKSKDKSKMKKRIRDGAAIYDRLDPDTLNMLEKLKQELSH